MPHRRGSVPDRLPVHVPRRQAAARRDRRRRPPGHRHYHHRPAERCHRHGALKENPGSDCPQLLCALAIKMAGGLRGLGAALPIYMWRAACGYIIGAGADCVCVTATDRCFVSVSTLSRLCHLHQQKLVTPRHSHFMAAEKSLFSDIQLSRAMSRARGAARAWAFAAGRPFQTPATRQRPVQTHG